MGEWLEEYGGLIVSIGIIILCGWGFLSILANNSAEREANSRFESSTQEVGESNETSDEQPAEFYGYECSDDCSGHEAGYEWADENYICEEYSSGDEYWDSHSDSFNEGVTAYIDENC